MAPPPAPDAPPVVAPTADDDDAPLAPLLAAALVVGVGRARTGLDAELEVSGLLGPVAVAAAAHRDLLAALEGVDDEEAERTRDRGDAPPDERATTLDVVEVLGASAHPDALAALRVLAAVGLPEVRGAAADAADRLAASGLADRPWARTVGAPPAQGAWAWSDDETGLDSLAVLYAERGREHVLLVVTRDGAVADLGLVSDRRRLDDVLTSLRTASPGTPDTVRVPVEEVPERLDRALALPLAASDETVEDVTALWPLVRARARAVG